MEELLALSELEERRLKNYTPKRRETYIIKKFIHTYCFVKWIEKKKATQTECWRLMNEHLVKIGYKPKKSIVSVHRLWDVPFDTLDIEYMDFYSKDY